MEGLIKLIHDERDELTKLFELYASAVVERYPNGGTQNIKIENVRYFLQWIYTGTFPRDNPGWRP